MTSLALKMLIGNRTTFLGVIFGIFLATLLISQQSAIFLGLLSRSYRVITDIPAPDIWVMDPVTESEDKLRKISLGNLDIIRSTQGVEWAAPLSIGQLPLVTDSEKFDVCILYGIDDATLIGAPARIVEGNIQDLRREGGVIVDVYSARGSLAKTLPNGTKQPLTVGDQLEINDVHAVVVGICKITQGFYPQPILFTGNQNFHRFSRFNADETSFIVAKTLPDTDIKKITDVISGHSHLQAYTRDQFRSRIIDMFLRTGILINFGLSVALGMIIGFSIAGQLFYQMTSENIKYYALIKAVGGNQSMITKMIIEQVLLVGTIGFILGITATMAWGMAVKGTTLAFLFPWQLLLLTASIILLICLFMGAMSIRKIAHADPKLLMGN
jgi:putative ABC transport system permease protein